MEEQEGTPSVLCTPDLQDDTTQQTDDQGEPRGCVDSPVQETSIKDIVDDTAESFSKFLNTSTETLEEDVKHVANDAEDLLGRLDEFHGIVATIHQQSEDTFKKDVPALLQTARRLQSLFDKIDQLELFMACIKRNVGAWEEEANAEKRKQSMKPLKSVFSAFRRGSASSPSKPTTAWVPPPVFRSDDFFHPESSAEQ